ncbi:interferon lambda receptor 1 [Heteronotia binoei]|uniref:interferon lambda receptor 1 n=1 Tax=Heteronotia binoei TaxID=13085 RepID=UPI002931A716|nr:interferon lambda receptor 1 [Heteronotia binoei]
MARWSLAALALLSVRQALGEMLLPPSRKVTLVSKDFSLFLTWLPGIGYPPGVFYTVQWTNVYSTWKDFQPCRNISETVCDITCASPDVLHSFDVRVKAQGSAGTISSAWVNLENIEYEVNVTLAPPALQIRKVGDTVVVNIDFSYPLCLKDIYNELTSDLEFWEAGANNRKKISMKNNTKNFDATTFNGSNYCFRARAVLNNAHSDFSEPTCVQLHSKAETWAFAAVPVPLLFILFVCIVFSLYQSRSRPKTVKSPQALDFSSFKCPKKFLEFTGKELISDLTYSGHSAVAENWSRLTSQIHSQLVPSVLEEYEDEEEEDTGGSRPYTEMHRFKKNNTHNQIVDLSKKEPDSCSESDSSQLDEGSMPDLMMPRFFGEVTSGFQEGETTSLSAGFSSEGSSVYPDSYPVAQREGRDLDEVTDLFQLSDSNLPTGKLFMPSESFHEASFRIPGDPQISLLGVQSNQDFCDLLLEDEKLSENDSCGCGSPVEELSPLNVPSREGLKSNIVGGNRDSIEGSFPEPKSYGYQPRPVHYLSRILQR